MIADPEAHVTHVFVAAPLRARLLSYAEHAGAPASLRMRAAELMQQPHGTLPHDDHFHVRIACPAHMNGCIENPVLRAPRRQDLVAHGRRGGASHALIATASAAAAEPAARTPAHLRTPAPAENAASPPGPAAAPRTPEPAAEPDTPPASMAVPIDDVDG
jgi:penicillin-insensitive murein endopeptidase